MVYLPVDVPLNVVLDSTVRLRPSPRSALNAIISSYPRLRRFLLNASEDSTHVRGTTHNSQSSSTPMVEIRLLPAVPAEWPAGRFRGLRTRGGYEVDVSWERGEITQATLRLVMGTNSDSTTRARRCRVLSRTQLSVAKKGEGVEAGRVPVFEDGHGVYEGGMFWNSLVVGALQHGEEVQLFGQLLDGFLE